MRDPVLGDGPQGRLWIRPGQAHMRGPHRRHAPGEAPAVAVEHREGPQEDRLRTHIEGRGGTERIQKRTTVGVDHPFRPPGRPAGVVDRDALEFICRLLDPAGVLGGRQPALVGGFLTRRVVDDLPQRRSVGDDAADPIGQRFIDDEQPRPRVVEDVGVLIGTQPGVEGHEPGAAAGHAEVRLERRQSVRRQDRDEVARTDALGPDGVGQGVCTTEELQVRDLAAIRIADRADARPRRRRSAQEGQRGQAAGHADTS